MATHFQGRFEVEFKYRLTDSAAFVHTLTALSPEVMVADNHEQDCYFDTADGALARRNGTCSRSLEWLPPRCGVVSLEPMAPEWVTFLTEP